MIVHLNVLALVVEDWVLAELNLRFVVHEQAGDERICPEEIAKELPKPYALACHCGSDVL